MLELLFDKIDQLVKGKRFLGWRPSEIRSLIFFAFRRISNVQLAQVSGSLTFTTVLALVPLLTIAFAIFTAFPIFNTFRTSLEAYFIQSLMPKAIATTITTYLNQLATKASRISAFGAIALLVTSIATLATIEKAFNQIWRVKQKRPFLKRTVVYWTLITFAPLLIGISLTATSYLFAATEDVVGAIPFSKTIYTVASIALSTFAFGVLYMAVPNRPVDWRDALVGGLVAGLLFEIAKRIFASFVVHIPTYTVIYGAVALIPIFLIWIYTSWLITMFGAVIAASLPIVKYERWWHVPRPGSRFVDAMALLETLYDARCRSTNAGISSWDIRQKTRLGFDEIESLLNQMIKAGWVGRLHADSVAAKKDTPLLGSEWWVMLANPSVLPMSQVYRLFVFEAQADTRLGKRIEKAVEQGFQESLKEFLLANKAQ